MEGEHASTRPVDPEPEAEILLQKPSTTQPGDKAYNNPFHLNAPQIAKLRKLGLLSRLPHITLAEINDKSKSDSMIRLIAVVQISWTTVQIIVRATRHLAVSQLEIAVMAFAVCAIITYSLNWYKPKGVEVPFTIAQYSGQLPDRLHEVLGKPVQSNNNWFFFMLTWSDAERQNPGLPHDNSRNLRVGDDASIIGLMIASVVFGGLHLAAWNLSFPTEIEKILWRVGSIWCTSSILFSVCLSLFDGFFELGLRSVIIGNSEMLVVAIGAAGYVLVRTFLMVEIFRCLFFLPPDAFTGTWATNIPHIA